MTAHSLDNLWSLPEDILARFEHCTRLDTEPLALIDEAYDGYVLVVQRAEQFCGHGGEIACRQAVGHAAGKVVDRDGNLAVGFRGLRGEGYGQEE